MAEYQPTGEYSTRRIVVDNLPTQFLEAGEDNEKTVVMLHSGEFGATAETSWERTIPVFAEDYHVVAPDIVGFGGSAKVFDHADIFDLRVNHLQRFLKTLDIDDAHFVGHSLGGGYIASSAAEEQDVWGMDKLVMAHGGGGIPEGLGELMKEFDGSIESIEMFMEALFYDEWWSEEYLEWKQEKAQILGHWQCIAGMVFDPPFKVEAKSRRMRTADTIDNESLVIGGKEDTLKPPEMLEPFVEEIGDNARLELFDKCKHGAQIEHSERFNELVLDFLSE